MPAICYVHLTAEQNKMAKPPVDSLEFLEFLLVFQKIFTIHLHLQSNPENSEHLNSRMAALEEKVTSV